MSTEYAPQIAFRDGPYFQGAILCEKVLSEQDGVKSAIRIFDRHTRTVAGPTPPIEMEPFTIEASLLLRFKSGSARGPHQLRVVLEKPSGESAPIVNQAILFEGEDDRGTDVVGGLTLGLDLAGLYWFDIYLDDTRITRVPLRVVYLRNVAN